MEGICVGATVTPVILYKVCADETISVITSVLATGTKEISEDAAAK
jgi:hypothetical protein